MSDHDQTGTLSRERFPGEKIIEGLKDALAHALVQRVLHIWCEEMAVERIAEALAAARREGAEEMRERAAQAADSASELMADSDIQFGSISGVAADLAKDLADAIRALPLTLEGPV